jgi:hypothetical protein
MALPQIIKTNGLERIPLPDPRRPERMPSLPAWVASRVVSLKDEMQWEAASGKYRMTPTLSANLILSQEERDVIAEHVADLERFRGPTPADEVGAEKATLVVVTRMMLALPAARQNEASAEARGEAYMVVLDDLPTWAVAAAVRRWYRGDAGDKYDYHWCPAPAELRELARIELWRVMERANKLKELLRAEPLLEFSEEHCHVMRVRLSNLIQETFGIPPVGTDGSGGKVSAS